MGAGFDFPNAGWVLAAVLTVLIAALFLIWKHGGFVNAIWGGKVERFGEVRVVGSAPQRSALFRLSIVRRKNNRDAILLEIYESGGDSSGWSASLQTIEANQALEVAALFEAAAKAASR